MTYFVSVQAQMTHSLAARPAPTIPSGTTPHAGSPTTPATAANPGFLKVGGRVAKNQEPEFHYDTMRGGGRSDSTPSQEPELIRYLSGSREMDCRMG